MKSKRISIIALAFIMLFSAIFGVSNLFLAKAEETTETLEQKLERFTSSDEIEGENMEITDFAFNYNSDAYSDSSIELSRLLPKIIPIELLRSNGTRYYAGEEYAFFIDTYDTGLLRYEESAGKYSNILIFDYNVKLEDKNGNYVGILYKPKFEFTPLVQVTVLTQILDGQIVVEQDNSIDETIKLKNLSAAVRIENVNEANISDEFYNKLYDNGGVIEGIDYDVYPDIEQEGSFDYSGWDKAGFALSAISLVTSGIPVIGPAIGSATSICALACSLIAGVDSFNRNNAEKIAFANDAVRLKESLYCINNNVNYERKDVQASYQNYIRDFVFGVNEDVSFSPLSANVQEYNYAFNLYLNIANNSMTENMRVSYAVAFTLDYNGKSVVCDTNNEISILEQNEGSSDLKEVAFSIGKIYEYYLNSKSLPEKPNGNQNAENNAYILDNNVVDVFEFKPQIEIANGVKQKQFGEYKFNVNNTNNVNAVILKKSNGEQHLDINEVRNLSINELINHSHKVKHQILGTSTSFRHTFEEQETCNVAGCVDEDCANSYYVVYYIYGTNLISGVSFNVNYEYLAESLRSAGNNAISLAGGQGKRFSYEPISTTNAIVSQNANISVKVTNTLTGESEEFNGIDFNYLFVKSNLYNITFINQSTNEISFTPSITFGRQINTSNGDDGNVCSIYANKTEIYKFTPATTGYYIINSATLISTWYDSNGVALIKNTSVEASDTLHNTVLLVGGNVYFVKVTKEGEGQEDFHLELVDCEETLVTISTDTINKDNELFYGIEINVSYSGVYNLKVDVNGNVELIENLNTDKYDYNLTSVVPSNGNMQIVVYIEFVNEAGNNQIASNVINQSFVQKDLASSSYAGDYVAIEMSNSGAQKQITIPNSVDVLYLHGNAVVNNVYFTVANSSTPLVIYVNDEEGDVLKLYSPTSTAVINTSRDIIFNVSGNLQLYGANGIDDGNASTIAGAYGIYANGRNLAFNGNGIMLVQAGNGGNGASRASNIDDYCKAGNGGTGVYAKSLIVNVAGLTINGGNGGNGRDGIEGTQGATGCIGGTGGYGVDGGTGGFGVLISGGNLVIATQTLTISAGSGGNGGKGGKGGKGGTGAASTRLFQKGDKGATGGTGGKGGDAGIGQENVKVSNGSAVNLTENPHVEFDAMLNGYGLHGTAGDGGEGGAGGDGGAGLLNGAGETGDVGAKGQSGYQYGTENTQNASTYSLRNNAERNMILRVKAEYIAYYIGEEMAYEIYGIAV